MSTAMNAFTTCGISPLNAQIFNNADFVASEAIDTELKAEKEPKAVSTSTSSTATISQQTGIITRPAFDRKTATYTDLNSSTTINKSYHYCISVENIVRGKTRLIKINKRTRKTDEGYKSSEDETQNVYTVTACIPSLLKDTCHCYCVGVEDNDDETLHICRVCAD